MSEAQNSTTTTQASAAANSSRLSTESVTGIVFGICATIASFVTIWQAHRAWKNRHKQPAATNPKTTNNNNTFDLTENSTFASRRSTTAAGAPSSSFVTVPEACLTRAAANTLPRAPPIADLQFPLPSITAQSPSASNQVAPTLATTRLPALQAALHRLGLSANPEPDEAPRSTTARESAVKAAIDGLMSSFDVVDGSDTDPSELVGDLRILRSERGD